MSWFPSEGYTLPLSFTDEAGTSALYSSLPAETKQNLATKNLTINLHEYAVGSSVFRASSALSSNFTLVATSVDTKGNEFVALAQHTSYNVVAAQFHIEKNAFEFQQGHYDLDDDRGDAAPHSEEGVDAGQQLGMWLVRQARKSEWKWEPQTLDKWIIYNWQARFSHKEDDTAWEQEYLFPIHPADYTCLPAAAPTPVVTAFRGRDTSGVILV